MLRHSYFFCRFLYYHTWIWYNLQEYFSDYIKKKEGKSGIQQASALCVMCITPRLMELWATLFAGCGKAALAFPYPVNGVVHDGMGSYAHFHGAFLGS